MVYQVWSNLLVFFFAISIAPGVSFNKGVEGFLVSGILYVTIIILLPKLIEFFKVNVNFWSFLVFGIFVSIGYFFLMEFILTNFLIIEPFGSSEAFLGIPFLRGISLTVTQVIVFAGIFTMLLVAINQTLFDRS